MDYLLLKTLHVSAAVALFSSLGALFLGTTNRKAASAIHGISLVVILLIGFAMLKKPPMDQYWWMVKGAIFLVIGAAPAFAKRNVLPGPALLGVCILLGTAAAYLGIYKPF